MTRSESHRDDPPPFEPLPDNKFSPQTHPSWHDAYVRCTRLFFWAVGRQPLPGAASYDMCSRVLGHLVLEAPTERGRDWLCKRILSCPDEQALARLAQKFIFTFIGACASSASPTHLGPRRARRSLFFSFSNSFRQIIMKIKSQGFIPERPRFIIPLYARRWRWCRRRTRRAFGLSGE